MIESPSILDSDSKSTNSLGPSFQMSTSAIGDVADEFTANPQINQCLSPQTYEYHKKLPSKKLEGKRMYHLGAEMHQHFSDEESAVGFQAEESTYENSTQDSAVQIKKRRRDGYHLGGGDFPGNMISESCCETEVEDEKAGAYEDIPRGQSLCTKLVHECFKLLCPCAVLFRALCRCEFGLFWKLCSSIFVMKGFWSSTISLGVCTLFKVHRLIPNLDLNVSNNTTEAYLFGLWTYTDKIIEENHSLEDFVEGEIERIETCRFHMQTVDEDAPDGLFLNDASIAIARVFAVMTVVIGCISMVSVWLTAANIFQNRCGGKRQWLLPSALAMCSVMECFIFLIFASSICRDTKYDEHRHCTLQADSGMLFASIASYLVAAVATAMMCDTPPQSSDGDFIDDCDSLDASFGSPGDHKIDKTFDDSDDSSSDGEGPSRFEIS